MKLIRTALAVGAAAWLAKRIADERGSRGTDSRGRGRSSGSRAFPLGRGSHSSAAPAAGGAFRDDRDVVGVGALRDAEVSER